MWLPFPAIDAALFTHERSNHFSLKSIRHLSEGVPPFLSSRSSKATRDVLKHLNRGVTPCYRVKRTASAAWNSPD